MPNTVYSATFHAEDEHLVPAVLRKRRAYAYLPELKVLLDNDKALTFYPPEEQDRLTTVHRRPRRKEEPLCTTNTSPF